MEPAVASPSSRYSCRFNLMCFLNDKEILRLDLMTQKVISTDSPIRIEQARQRYLGEMVAHNANKQEDKENKNWVFGRWRMLAAEQLACHLCGLPTCRLLAQSVTCLSWNRIHHS